MNPDSPYLRQLQAGASYATAVFDMVEDTFYFVKNDRGQYVDVNETALRRCGLSNKQEIIGKTACDIFPGHLGESYFAQDNKVIRTQVPLRAELELHMYTDGSEGWCLSWKAPIISPQGITIGLTGLSRDISSSLNAESDLKKVAKALRYTKENLTENLQIEELAKVSGLSAFQLDSRIRNLFGLSTGQFITQSRIEFASAKLRNSSDPIVQIARAAGYTDASAFTRQFRKMVGTTPTAYRQNRSDNRTQ